MTTTGLVIGKADIVIPITAQIMKFSIKDFFQ